MTRAIEIPCRSIKISSEAIGSLIPSPFSEKPVRLLRRLKLNAAIEQAFHHARDKQYHGHLDHVMTSCREPTWRHLSTCTAVEDQYLQVVGIDVRLYLV